jgi:hypothetical protein
MVEAFRMTAAIDQLVVFALPEAFRDKIAAAKRRACG